MVRTREDVLHQQHNGAPMRRPKNNAMLSPSSLAPCPDRRQSELHLRVRSSSWKTSILFDWFVLCANPQRRQTARCNRGNVDGWPQTRQFPLEDHSAGCRRICKQTHSLMLRRPSSCALHIKVTLNVCTLSELSDANTCRTSRLNDRDAKACLATK